MPEYKPLPPFAATSGAKAPRIVLLGEAWGGNEDEIHRPFVGEAGKELFRMLGEAMPFIAPELHAKICDLHKYGSAWVKKREEWLGEASIAMTNVLAFRPQANKLETCCGNKKEVGGDAYPLPAITKGKYLLPQYLAELERLAQELVEWKPNLVVALGNTALWALSRTTAIGQRRGTVFAGNLGQWSGKAIATYHPAGVLRNWSWRPVVVADLMKAEHEAKFAEIKRPVRHLLVNPTIDEVEGWTNEVLASQPEILAPDIETACGQITCIGFAKSVGEALVIPFVVPDKDGDYCLSYWPDAAVEGRAWACVDRLLASGIVKVGQNFIYDLQYLLRLGLKPQACTEDTMLLHHSLFPELPKGLGFLGSVYTNDVAWKTLRTYKPDTEKRDE